MSDAVGEAEAELVRLLAQHTRRTGHVAQWAWGADRALLKEQYLRHFANFSDTRFGGIGGVLTLGGLVGEIGRAIPHETCSQPSSSRYPSGGGVALALALALGNSGGALAPGIDGLLITGGMTEF